MIKMNLGLMLVVVSCGGVLFVPLSEAGCLELGLCCTGRDVSCTTTGWRPDRTFGTCYCDQACSRTLDCCHDYSEACTGVSCTVSEWSSWSDCTRPCKSTYRVRRRYIIQKPTRGELCPALVEKAGCLEYWNKQGFECRQDIVPALITTEGFGQARKRRHVAGENENTGYCVEFQLKSLTKDCLLTNNNAYARWMRYLKEGHIVCVECQIPALNPRSQRCYGDGKGAKRNQVLHWQSVGNPRCKGIWTRVRQVDSCSCPSVHSFLFI